MYFCILAFCLLVAVNGSLAASDVPSNSLMSEGHRVGFDRPIASPKSQEDESENRPVARPVFAPFEQVKPLVKTSSTKPFITSSKTPTRKLSSNPVVTYNPKPSESYQSLKPTIYSFPTSSTLKICQYSGYCSSDSDCHPGNSCRLDQLPWYSQCLADILSYKTSSCKLNWGTECSQDTDCCDPGAFCNSNSYRQCQQPTIGSTGCLDPTKGSFPTKAPSSTASPSFKISINPTASTNGPTTSPSNYPTALLTNKPTLNPTSKPVVSLTSNPTSPLGGALVIFNTYLNLQFVDCNALKLCTTCQHAIELSQQQVINATLHLLANVTYIDCIVGRRRLALSERSRHLVVSSNVTLVTTFISKYSNRDSAIAKATIVSSVTNGVYTNYLQKNSQQSNATETKTAIVNSVAVGTSTFLTLSPTMEPSNTPIPISCKPTRTPSISPSDKPSSKPTPFPSLRPVSSSPSDTPTSDPSKQSATIIGSSIPTQNNQPTGKLTRNPSISPSDKTKTTSKPTVTPSFIPSGKTTLKPTRTPSVSPSTVIPTIVSSKNLLVSPSTVSSTIPSNLPSLLALLTISPSSSPSVACLVVQGPTISDLQYLNDTSIKCLTVSSTVTSIGIIIFMYCTIYRYSEF